MALEDNLRHLRASDIFAEIPQIAEDMETRPGDEETLDFLTALVSGPTPEEAMTFAAYMLQPRQAVWWGHECLQSVSEQLEPQDAGMLDLAAAWVADPSEDNRYRALEAAEGAEQKSPGVWVAYGAGWSGGSIVAPDADPVMPPLVLCGRAIHIATLNALARVDTSGRNDRIRGFVSMADILARA
jgi:hypothetical protein